MKPWILLTCAVFGALCIPRSDAQTTVEWGASGAPLIDSDGDGIDDSFVFELGAFALNFNPDDSNVGEWLTHWRVFDRLIYDSVFGFSTSSSTILSDGTSDSLFASSDPAFNFSGLDAYVWIRNGVLDGDQPLPGSEWFLARAEIWRFPAESENCCETTFLEWSTSDLTPTDIPKWGLQSNVPGGDGVFTFTPNEGFDGIQTHTFIPEPSSSLLLMLGAAGLVLTRRRHLVAH